ncbi:MAG: gas vesicle protein K [Proteobacteria bacterium]|nr:gas vesicle protein K [Pseudomonadota bacterium]
MTEAQEQTLQHVGSPMSMDTSIEIETSDPDAFVQVMDQPSSLVGRLDVADDQAKNGLGQLVLTLVKLIHELLEKQAIRRMDSGTLSDEEIERLGTALWHQAEMIDRLRREFGLREDELNLDLGPLGKLL